MAKLIELTEFLPVEEYPKFRIFIHMESLPPEKYAIKKKDLPKLIQLFDTCTEIIQFQNLDQYPSDKEVYSQAFQKSKLKQFYPLGPIYKSILLEYFSWKIVQDNYPKLKEFLKEESLHRAGYSNQNLTQNNPLDLTNLDRWTTGYFHLAKQTLDYQIASTATTVDRSFLTSNLHSQITDFKLFYLFKRFWKLNHLFNLTPSSQVDLLRIEFAEELSQCRIGLYNQEDPRIAFLAKMLPFWVDQPDWESFRDLVNDFTGEDTSTNNNALNFPDSFKVAICHLLIILAHRAWERGYERFMEVKLNLILRFLDDFTNREIQVKILFTSFLNYLMACPPHSGRGLNSGAQMLRKLLKKRINDSPELSHMEVFQQIDANAPAKDLMPNISTILIQGYKALHALEAYEMIRLCEAITLLGLGINLHTAAKIFRQYRIKGSIKHYKLQSRIYFLMAYFDGMYGSKAHFFNEAPEPLETPNGEAKKNSDLNSEYLGDVSREIRNLLNRKSGSKKKKSFDNAAILLDHIHTIYFRKGKTKKKGLTNLEADLMKDEPVFFRDWFVLKLKQLQKGKY